MAWAGAGSEQGAEFGVADLNARGGVLGEQIELITADDYCEGEQAIAAAKKLVAAAVVAVVGHQCSGAAIPASKVYSQAGLLMISTFATNPKLTEQGFTNVFRVVGRDDLQGRIAGDLLAERWGNKPIAILHDGQAFGKRLAEETRKRLNERGITAAMFEAIEPGKADYWDVVQKMRAMSVEVLYYGGYKYEAGLIIRQAREHGYQLNLVGGDGIGGEDFGLVAGSASDGTLMTAPPVPSGPEAAELALKFTETSQNTFTAYAALQAWAQQTVVRGCLPSVRRAIWAPTIAAMTSLRPSARAGLPSSIGLPNPTCSRRAWASSRSAIRKAGCIKCGRRTESTARSSRRNSRISR